MIELTYANYKDQQNEIRNQLEKFAQKHTLSIYNLARLLDVAYETINCFMVDNRVVRYSTLCKIAELLNKDDKE